MPRAVTSPENSHPMTLEGGSDMEACLSTKDQRWDESIVFIRGHIQSVGLRETYATLICSSPGSGLGTDMLYNAGARRKRVMKAFILIDDDRVRVA